MLTFLADFMNIAADKNKASVHALAQSKQAAMHAAVKHAALPHSPATSSGLPPELHKIASAIPQVRPRIQFCKSCRVYQLCIFRINL
jgi:hypothetical protein